MVTYIGMLKFTDKGLAAVKGTTQRAAAAKEVAHKFGVNMREVFWTLGEHDLVCVVEAENDQSIAAFSLAMATQGHLRSSYSMRAYTAEEMEQVLARLP